MHHLPSPKVILGTMNFGEQVDEKTADRMIRIFLERGHEELDTAYRYGDGGTEEILGRILGPSLRGKVYLATKVTPHPEGLKPEVVTRQLETSLQRLKTEYADLLYLHAPDLKTPVEQTLQACENLFRQGKFRHLGISNYAAWQVVDIWHQCRANGWVRPVVYQGRYNAITRDVEGELFPAIRALGITFYAYNPLAGGLLTGKYIDPEKKPHQGRFALKQSYADRYWKESYFRAMDVIRRASAEARLGQTECALRWITHHSLLKGAKGDGYIMAATNLDQFEENLESSLGGEIPPDMATAFDRGWEMVRPDCPRYFET